MDRTEAKYQLYDGDELTLKELILKLLEFWGEIKRNKLLILIVATICAAALIFWNKSKPLTYTSALTFMVGETDDKSSGMIGSPFDQVQFEGIRNHKLTEIARSSKIVHQVLLSSDSLNKVIPALQIIDIYGLKEKWKDIEWSKVDSNIAGVSKYSDKNNVMVIDRLHEFLVGNKLNTKAGQGLMSFTYDSDTELFQINVETINEELSKSLVDNFYKVLSDFYIEKTVGKPTKVYKQLKSREDSLRLLLNSAESGLAYASDRTRGIVSSVAKVNQNRLQRKLENLSDSYNETRANRQKIEFVLHTETPDFQIIDQTFIPILSKGSIAKSAIIGFIIGGFSMILVVLGRYIVLDALTN